MATSKHVYDVTATWLGSTDRPDYSRAHLVGAPGVADPLELSSDAVFGGDGALLNPEALLVAAAASCQLLSFLALARRRRMDVVAYRDAASGEMPTSTGSMSIERIVLRPEITFRGDYDESTLDRLLDEAHHRCFIANSLRSEIVLQPTWRRQGNG